MVVRCPTSLRSLGAATLTLILIATIWSGWPQPTRRNPAFSVAIILPGAIDDDSWNQEGFEALEAIERQLAARVTYSASVTREDAPKRLRELAAQGYDLLIAHGGAYDEAVVTVSREYPETFFLSTSLIPEARDNLACYFFEPFEAGYVAGVVAGLKTQRKKVTIVQGEQYPIKTTLMSQGFQAGAKRVDPGIVATSAWVGSSYDAGATLDVVKGEIAEGADVLALNIVVGTEQSMQLAQTRGVKVIGWQRDRYEVAPQAVLTSIVYDLRELLLMAARRALEGQWQGGLALFGFKDKVLALAPLRASLTDEEKRTLEHVLEDLRNGKIEAALHHSIPTGKTISSTTAAQSTRFRVAAILPGTEDDGGWSQRVFEGLELIRRELGASISYESNVTADNAEARIRALAAKGPELLIAYGGEYVPALKKVAREFPDVDFVTTDAAGGNNSNLGSFYFDPLHTAYLAGVIAATKTRSAKVAFIIGDRHLNTLRDAEAFQEGVRRTKPSVTSSIVWVGSWFDQERAASLAREQLEHGVDILAVNTYQSDAAVIAAAAQARAFVIGFHEDRYPLAPKTVLTSILVDYGRLLLHAGKLAFEGRWEGRHHKLGLREDVVRLAPFRGAFTADEENAIRKVESELRRGEVRDVFVNAK